MEDILPTLTADEQNDNFKKVQSWVRYQENVKKNQFLDALVGPRLFSTPPQLPPETET